MNLSVILKPTHNCNLNCKYCYDAPERARLGGYIMPITVLQEFVSKIESNKSVHIIFHGGEPTTVPISWYHQAMKVFLERSDVTFSFSMQSNGFQLSDEFIEMLLMYSIKIGFSYDMASQYSRVTSFTEQNDRVISNIFRYRDKGAHVGVISVVTRESQTQLWEMYKTLTEEYDFSPAFNIIFPTEESNKNNLSIDTSTIYRDYKKFVGKMINEPNKDIYFLERGIRNQINLLCAEKSDVCCYDDCTNSWINFAPDGMLNTCDEPIKILGKGVHISDINTLTDFFTTGYYKEYTTLVKKLRSTCSGCFMKGVCHGGCPLRHLVGLKSVSDLKLNKSSCDHIRMVMMAVFSEMQTVDIYDDKSNSYIRKLFTGKLRYTPMEVNKMLLFLGIDVKLNGTEFNLQLFEYTTKLNCYLRDNLVSYGEEVSLAVQREALLVKYLRKVM